MFRERFSLLKWVEEPPHKTALAFAIGIFLAISPLLGLHTVIGLLVAWLFRLNRVVTLTGVFVTNPWTIVPIYTFCTWVGSLILGVDLTIIDIDWHDLTLRKIARELEHILMPFVVGSAVVATVVAFASYFIVLKSVRGSRTTPSGLAPIPAENPGGKQASTLNDKQPPADLSGPASGQGAGAPGEEG
jgi:uncharacterized protein (DUF2062 family)